jgi:hypothetical protein
MNVYGYGPQLVFARPTRPSFVEKVSLSPDEYQNYYTFAHEVEGGGPGEGASGPGENVLARPT